jgi:hypothetical protein
MSQRRKPGVIRQSNAEQLRRDEEVLRAKKELAAYFKGQRTEREARAALKIIRAFVRERERLDAKSRPPLPGADVATTAMRVTNRKVASGKGGRHRPKPQRKPPDQSSESATASSEPATPVSDE